MKTLSRFVVAVLATATLFFAGCSGKDTHEKLADDAAAQMDKIATAVASVKDKASAEKAVTEIKAASAEMKKLSDRYNALGAPSAEVKTKVDTKMKAKEEEMKKKMANLANMGEEAGGILMAGLIAVTPDMEAAGKTFGLK
jgi:hypothetical protein